MTPSQQLNRVNDFRKWKDIANANFPAAEVSLLTSKGLFDARLGTCELGSSAFASVFFADSIAIDRTSYLADIAERGYIKLLWLHDGKLEIEQEGRQTVLTPGTAAVYDTACPYTIKTSEQSHFSILLLPYQSCPGWERIAHRVRGSMLTDISTSRATLGALTMLLEASTSGSDQGLETVTRAVQSMVTTTLHHLVGAMADSRRHELRISEAHRYIIKNICDPDLNPDKIAAALRMSRRALYLLFQDYPLSPAELILETRLELCREALTDPAQLRTITEIAFEHGFSDSASFSRSFKSRCGLSPSQWRAQAREDVRHPGPHEGRMNRLVKAAENMALI